MNTKKNKIQHPEDILFIHEQTHVGGGQTYVTELVRAMRLTGSQVTLLESEKPITVARKIFSKSNKTIIWNVYSEFPIWVFLLSVLLRKNNIFIVYGIWQLERKSTFWDVGSLKSNLIQSIMEKRYLIEQFCFCFLSSSIIHLSDYAKRLFLEQPLLRHLSRKRQVIIFGGANKIFKPLFTHQEKNAVRRDLGMPDDAVILLMVGRIEKRKNYVDGIKVLAQLRKKMPNKHVFLYLVASHGFYNDQRYYEEILTTASSLNVGKYIRIVSGVSHDNLVSFYQAADVFLMLSRELETFGLVTLEAIQSGCSVFGYSTSATPEIVHYKTNKYLVSLGEINKLTSLISEYLQFTKKEKSVETDNLRDSVKIFSWENSVNILNKLV